MILQRIAGSLKTRDWGTAALEILIVVLGIFLGLQVGEWNDARKDNVRAKQVLEELRVEFKAINNAAGGLATYYQGVISDLETLMNSLSVGEVKPEAETAIKNAIAYGDVFGDPPPPSGTFRDLMSSGNLALINDKDLRLRLIEYHQSLDIIAESDANINNLLGHFAYAFKKHARLDVTFHVPETQDLTFIDVGLPTVSAVNYEAILMDPDFRVAAEQHWRLQIGRYINVRVNQSKIAQIQHMIDRNLRE